jgi:Skp family chaperone for outer membrane proteins
MSKPTRKRLSLDEMSEEEARAYVQELRTRLQHKQQRERAWLDRRASRGVQTRTDEDYERDQDLEAELVALLDKLLQTE